MAERDVPAFLNKILAQTKQSQLHIVGQSMGTTTVFGFLSENHAYDGKVYEMQVYIRNDHLIVFCFELSV